MKKYGVGFLAAALAFSLPTGVFADSSEGEAKDRSSADLEFKDTGADYWASESIQRMREKDIFNGYEDNTFRPSKPVTRMQTIVTAVRMLGLEEEAKSKDTNTSVPFRDAESYFGKERNEWAKGYVLVALEEGLFDPDEKILAPNSPAERIWVATTLVRALGLGDEAMEALNEEPDFKDRNAIPSGSVGYANIAEEYDIISGNQENKFLPRKPITRAQMAAVLDRTYDELLTEKGATALQGTLVGHDENNQTLVVQIADGTVKRYTYREGFLIFNQGEYVHPEDLQEGETLSLQTLDGAVKDAAVLTPEAEEQGADTDIHAAEVEVTFANDEELELKYSMKRGEIEAKIEEESGHSKREIKGGTAVTELQQYLDAWQLDASMSTQEVVNKIRNSLERQGEVEEMEVNIQFTNGVKVTHENEPLEENEAEVREVRPTSQIDQFTFEAEWFNGNEENWNYKKEDGKAAADVEGEVNGEEIVLEEKEAISFVEERLQELLLSSDQSAQDILDQLIVSKGWEEEKIAELQLEVTFANGIKKEIGWTRRPDSVEA